MVGMYRQVVFGASVRVRFISAVSIRLLITGRGLLLAVLLASLCWACEAIGAGGVILHDRVRAKDLIESPDNFL